MNPFSLKKGSTCLTLADPLAKEPYYRGTRFDRSGIILSLEHAGHVFVRPWFREYDPYMHDAVSGPAEEFTQIGYDAAFPGENFLKIGVGWLKRNYAPYDRFKLYEVVDSGHISVEKEAGSALFTQILPGCYDYSKRVLIPEEGKLRLEHSLKNTGGSPLDFYVYSHNFFMLDGKPVNGNTRIILSFKPIGDWRAKYDCVRLADFGIAFDRALAEGESVFMGNLREAETSKVPFTFVLADYETRMTVSGTCDRKIDYSVFWANPDVACIEPYMPLHVLPGETAEWTLEYLFSKGKTL